MSRFWSPLVHRLTPYVAGEQPVVQDLVKLNTNENPYGPSPRAIAAIRAEAGDGLRLYPDPHATILRQAIAVGLGVQADQVFVGNGSDEVLAHAFQGLLNHDGPLLFPDITYSFYPVYCGLYGIAYREIPIDAAMQVDVDDYAGPCGAIILPNPNAPTGSALPLSAIRRLVEAHPDQVVVVDEAYVDFGGESAVPLVADHPNLLVIQTFSKSRSLAGLRVGFAIGQRHLIEALERVKDSFNSYPLDRLAIVGAVASYEDTGWFEETRGRVMASRQRLFEALNELGFEILPSAANFVFARHPAHRGADLAKGLRAQSVIVRHFAKPRIEDFLRISIGTDAQCDRLIAALKTLVA
ncbi:histidinol-phosphate transaminase [Kaistia dalseonensis]|uniref:Histidinol-phosphate aminotransferase n=1 Tax=Kaistia dalseonensis TaxID=410840 RepID=A0ABU0H6Z0_9HYPH|nr:histidinol-phosphate transaminase [Kaistia dalseonensis]MCX5494964.1 histidinol-phosphate transaminase [Kaistia dalseonensis]MDQ0437545.1 histidinol-phosphate aminotransferase [Kaistia dalseonensis]